MTTATRANALHILIAASVMMSLAMGMRQCLGLFLPPMTQALSLSASDFTFAIAVQNIVWGLAQAPLGAVADRWGLRPVMVRLSPVAGSAHALERTLPEGRRPRAAWTAHDQRAERSVDDGPGPAHTGKPARRRCRAAAGDRPQRCPVSRPRARHLPPDGQRQPPAPGLERFVGREDIFRHVGDTDMAGHGAQPMMQCPAHWPKGVTWVPIRDLEILEILDDQDVRAG